MIKVLTYSVVAIVSLLVLVAIVVWLGARMSLDQDYRYTAAANELPPFSPVTGHELVQIDANGYRFRARVAGFSTAEEKPVVILLHGFPVTSAMWLELIEPLANAGFKVVAFDQRGYSPGARPEGTQAYASTHLVSDVLAIADAVGAERFHLVGHDWGAAVGWGVVLGHASRVISWSGLSIAHPRAFAEALQEDPDQQARSRYFMFFRTPGVPEAVFGFNDFAMLKGAFAAMPRIEVDEYLAMFREPGGLTAGLNWYRAMSENLMDSDDSVAQVQVPTVFIWGNQDGAVGRAAIDSMEQYMLGPYRNVELDAGHWLLADEPERVVAEVVEHVVKYK